jgi:hypothetical protein
MTTDNHKGFPTPQEEVVLRLYDTQKLSVFEIANKLFLNPPTVMRIVRYWRPESLTNNNEGKTMAKKDKNKEERQKNMDTLRSGDSVYSLDPDKVRGLIGDLAEGEGLILIKQQTTGKVNVRLGDVAYSR